MKSAIFFLFLVLLVNPTQDKFRLNGKYKFIPQKGEVYFIEFNDSVFVKTSPNGVTNRGVIHYGENKIYLRDYVRELKEIQSKLVYIETTKPQEKDLIALKTGKQDSIEYSYHTYYEGGNVSWLHIKREYGTLIKVK